MDGWPAWLERWRGAGLLDDDAAARIRAYEMSHARSGRLRWPILIALGFGALMVCAGILLFVAAHWDDLSTAQRFSLVVTMVGIFHVAGALTTERFRAMSEALHAVGTAALGAGLALSGQIFNLEEHWPGGIMLWALGAGLAWALLRHTTQMLLFAMLAPAWLACEWIAAVDDLNAGARAAWIPAAGVCLLGLTYLAAESGQTTTRNRRAMKWLGCAVLLLSAPIMAILSWELGNSLRPLTLSRPLLVAGWSVALGGPLALAVWLRRFDAWPHAIAAVWVLVLYGLRGAAGDLATFAWWALGAIGLAAWGVRDGRGERINVGAILFAATVLAFYFSQVMDKLGRSAALLGLGALFLGGGWALERLRRSLIRQSKERAG